MFNGAGEVDLLQSIAVAMLLYFLGLVYVFLLKSGNKAIIIKLFSFAFIVRIISVYAIYYYLISIGDDGFASRDDGYYDHVARQISYELSKGFSGFKEYGVGIVNIGYFNLNGWLYYYLNFDTLSARMINVVCSSLTVVLFYLIIETLFDKKRAFYVAMIIALLPNLVFWASLQYKDTIIIFSSTMLIYLMVCRFRESFNFISVILYAFFMFILWHFRKDYSFPLMGVGVLWLLIKYTKLGVVFDNKKSGAIKYFVLTFVGSILIISMLLTGAGSDFMDNMQYYTDAQSQLANTGSGFTRYLRITSPAEIYKLPAAIAFTALAPLPSFSDVFIPDMAGFGLHSMANLFLIMLLPFVILGFFIFKSDKIQFTDELLLKWLPLMTLIMLSVLYMGNLRYKSTLLVYFACWAGLALYERKKLRTKLLLIYFGSFFAIAAIVPVAIIFR